MKIGVPKEIKVREGRVAMTHEGVRSLVHHGHEVLVEKGAGLGSRISDTTYEQAGGRMGLNCDEGSQVCK
jgi:alanine dehydrogenase